MVFWLAKRWAKQFKNKINQQKRHKINQNTFEKKKQNKENKLHLGTGVAKTRVAGQG